jgi:hypothetical protein
MRFIPIARFSNKKREEPIIPILRSGSAVAPKKYSQITGMDTNAKAQPIPITRESNWGSAFAEGANSVATKVNNANAE